MNISSLRYVRSVPQRPVDAILVEVTSDTSGRLGGRQEACCAVGFGCSCDNGRPPVLLDQAACRAGLSRSPSRFCGWTGLTWTWSWSWSAQDRDQTWSWNWSWRAPGRNLIGVELVRPVKAPGPGPGFQLASASAAGYPKLLRRLQFRASPG